MLKVAKLNAAGDKVENVFNVKKEKCIDPATGAPSDNSVINFAVKLWGAGNYVWNKDSDKTRASTGYNYDSSNKIFYEDRPQSCTPDLGTPVVFASWTLNTTTGEWICPQNIFDESLEDKMKPMGHIVWDEAAQKWTALKSDDTRQDIMDKVYKWNKDTEVWELE